MKKIKQNEEINGMIVEYNALREEILYALRSRIWGVASYTIISGALLTFAENSSSAWPYICTILIAFPFLIYTTYLERIRIRTHIYISCDGWHDFTGQKLPGHGLKHTGL